MTLTQKQWYVYAYLIRYALLVFFKSNSVKMCACVGYKENRDMQT